MATGLRSGLAGPIQMLTLIGESRMTIRKSRSPDKRSSPLPLFDWADARKRWQEAGYPAHHLSLSRGLSPDRARLVAGLLYDGDKR